MVGQYYKYWKDLWSMQHLHGLMLMKRLCFDATALLVLLLRVVWNALPMVVFVTTSNQTNTFTIAFSL